MGRVNNLDIVNCGAEVQLNSKIKKENEAYEKLGKMVKAMFQYVTSEGLYDSYKVFTIQDTSVSGGICSVKGNSRNGNILIIRYKDLGDVSSERHLKNGEVTKSGKLPRRCEDALINLLVELTGCYEDISRVVLNTVYSEISVYRECNLMLKGVYDSNFMIESVETMKTMRG